MDTDRTCFRKQHKFKYLIRQEEWSDCVSEGYDMIWKDIGYEKNIFFNQRHLQDCIGSRGNQAFLLNWWQLILKAGIKCISTKQKKKKLVHQYEQTQMNIWETQMHAFKQILMQNKKRKNRSSIVARNYTIKISKIKCNQLNERYNKTF